MNERKNGNLREVSKERASGFPIEVPFLETLGARLVEFTDQQAVVELKAQSQLLNSFEVLHGGVVMTLLDVAMAMAARPLDQDLSTLASAEHPGGNITVEMKTSFLGPATGDLRAIGTCLRRGGSLSFCEAELIDSRGRLCAKASGTFKFWQPRLNSKPMTD